MMKSKKKLSKKNYFEFLIHCATQKDLYVGFVLQISLEIIWTLTFNNKIREIMTSYRLH